MLAVEISDEFSFDRCRHETSTKLIIDSLCKRMRNAECGGVDVVGEKNIIALVGIPVSVAERPSVPSEWENKLFLLSDLGNEATSIASTAPLPRRHHLKLQTW